MKKLITLTLASGLLLAGNASYADDIMTTTSAVST
jgi:hypothetical protein